MIKVDIFSSAAHVLPAIFTLEWTVTQHRQIRNRTKKQPLYRQELIAERLKAVQDAFPLGNDLFYQLLLTKQ